MARFVVIDDSKVARNFLRSVLEGAGHEIVAEGVNGLEGFDLYRAHKPDIITLDVVMPILTGTECLKKIMADSPDANIIVVTSVGKNILIEESIKSGAKAVIVKPFDEGDVLPIVNAILNKES